MVKTKVYLNGDLIDINGDNQSDDENIVRSNILDGVLNRIILKDSESYTQDGITVTLNSPEKGNVRIFFNNIQTRTISVQLTNVMSLKKGSYVLKSGYIGNVYRKIILYLYDCTTEEKIVEIDNNHSSAKFTLDNDNDNLMVFATITGERFGDSNEYFINPSITFEKYKNESFVAGAKTNSTLSNDIDNINNLIIDNENKILEQNDVIKKLITDGVQNYFPLKKFEEEEIQGCILTRYPNGYSLYIDIPAGELYDPVDYSIPISDYFSLKKGKYSIGTVNHTPVYNVSFIIKDDNDNTYSDDFELINDTSSLIGYLEFEITSPTFDNHIYIDPYICLQGYSSLGSEMNAMNNLELTKKYNNVSKNKLDKTGGDLTGDLSVHDSSTLYPQSRLTKWGIHHYIDDGAYVKMGIGGSPQYGMIWYKPSSNSPELSYKLPDSSGTLALTSDNVQADWNQTNSSASDYIKNKPTIPSIPDVSDKMDKNNPTGTGSLSMNRRENVSVGSNSSTLGVNCSATGTGSHAQGNATSASGNYSFAEGNQTTASGHNSHAGGVGTQALNNMAVFGLYNDPQSGDLFEVGNGTSNSLKSNALRVTSDGEVIDGHGNKISDINNIIVPTKTSDLTNDSNFVSDNNYVHTDNNYTNNEKTKLLNIESNAQVNTIEKIKVNGTEQTITNKEVALTIMTNSVNDLVNYYKKSETYSQTEINSLISAIPKFSIKVVDNLPTTNISLTTVYLLRNSGSETQNLYEEYIRVEVSENTYVWEKLGQQSVDLSGYVTTTSLNTILNDYVTTVNLNTLLGNYVTTTDFNSALANKIDTTDSRLSDSRPASDVYEWAKAPSKPSYSKSEVGLSNVGNFKAVSTVASQELTDTEKQNARINIGAGTSNFSGSYNDLTDQPPIPTVNNATLTIQKNGINVQTFTANQSTNATANITVPTKTSELTNDSGFLTSHQTVDSELNSTSTNPVQNKVINTALNGKSDTSHTHNYAGSSSVGGVATNAARLSNTIKIGDTNKPVYFNANGVPVAINYEVNKSVPSDAVFTDTNTWNALVGATSLNNGTAGYAPAPPKDGYNTKYLRADGTWSVPPDNNTTYESKSASSGGTDVSLVTTGEKYNWNNKTSNTGTVTQISAGVGLTGGNITTSGTIKAKLKSETKATNSSVAVTNTANRQYAVTEDNDGYLSVNVPWIEGTSITVDSSLSTTSTNPVQNKVITEKINKLENILNSIGNAEEGAW